MPKNTGLPTEVELRQTEQPAQAYPPKPEEFTGTEPEWAIYWALTKLGAEFNYQAPILGGRRVVGGAVADFVVYDPARVLIRVQGSYWHYASSGQMAHDVFQKAQMEAAGWQVIDIDEEDALRAPLYYVQEALHGVDHSLGARM